MDGAKEGEEVEVLEGEQIYLLMKKEYRLSRNTRALWYFSHINKEIQVSNRNTLAAFSGDLDVVSVVPREPVPADWDWDTGHLYKYHVAPTSMVTFLSQQYKFVYLLDYSPSAACTDIKKGSVLLDQMVLALRRSLEGVTRPFYVPGSQLLFKPDIFVSVIAWTPFLCAGAQAVLHQGWLLTPENMEDFITGVKIGLAKLEEHIARVAAIVIDELETIKMQADRIMGDLFDESLVSGPQVPSIPMAAPDTGFVNMIQTGQLALQLLPQHSAGGLIVITDGVINIPDVNILDPMLNQLRTKMTSLSFLQVSSSYHPNTGLGYVPNNELLAFLSLATSGAYLPRAPEVEPSEPYLYVMNDYHVAFLAWSFRKCLEGVKILHPTIKAEKVVFRKGAYSEIKNPFFIEASEEPLIEKRMLEMTVNSNLTSILSCRMREGYTVNSVKQNGQEMAVKLTLPWKHQTFLHYTVLSVWPPANNSEWEKCKVEVSVEGPYDILNDLICQRDKQFSSHHRMAVVKRFYFMLQHLSQTDQLLVHLHSFTAHPAHYTIPDPIKNGVPLYTTSGGSTAPVLYSQDFAHPIFTKFWQPVCSLDLAVWHRWMHTDRIGLILQHDHPLPKHLLTTSSNGRYHAVQCRKAAKGVTDLLKGWAEFCLLESSSYIRFLRDEKGHPNSFYVIRVTSKPPCFVVWLAFLGGTPGSLRHKIYQELVGKLRKLTVTQRVCWRDLPEHRILKVEGASEDEDSSSETEMKPNTSTSRGFSEVYACVSMTKPVERILVRYERMPTDFCSLLGPFPNRSFSPTGYRGPDTVRERSQRNAAAAFLTLSRYVQHQRWIWSIQACPRTQLAVTSVARILNTLCKMRLHEGFAFAHSSNGIQNMVLEVPLSGSERVEEEKGRDAQTCTLQFIIFPPHTTSSAMEDSISEEEEEDEGQDDESDGEGEVQIITELWTEPQTGKVLRSVPAALDFIKGLGTEDISRQFFPKDLECISTLITFEHLCLMCQNPSMDTPPAGPMIPPLGISSPPKRRYSFSGSQLRSLRPACALMRPFSGKDTETNPGVSPLTSSTTIRHVPFAFDLLSLLPKSHQTELLFSLLIQDLSPSYSWYSSHKPFADRPNEMVFEQLFSELLRVSDREVELSARDHLALPDLIRPRQNENFRFKSTTFASSGSSPPPPQDRRSFSRRHVSGISACASTSTESSAFRESLSMGEPASSADVSSDVPKWRCFVKAISPTHLVLTILPASFQDLKSLILHEDVLSSSASSTYVNVVKKPFDKKESEDSNEGLEGLSINSSVSHLEAFPLEPIPPEPASGRRQRSGSDVFEMTRPKPPSVRKTSGDAVVMRDRTSSLDGFSQFKAKAVLKNLSQLTENGPSGDRNRCKSMDSKPAADDKSCSGTKNSVSKSTSGASRGTSSGDNGQLHSTPLKSPWPLQNPPPPKYGSLALPIYVFDCSVASLTSSILFKDKVEKPGNFYQNHLFQPEPEVNNEEKKESEAAEIDTAVDNMDEEIATAEKELKTKDDDSSPLPDTCEFHPRDEVAAGHVDREIKQRCHIMQMIYFKSYVSVLFRCLQLLLPVHSYDVQHSMDYCDNESSLELDLAPFIQAACAHREMVLQCTNEKTVTNDEMVENANSYHILDMDKLKAAKPCSKTDVVHKVTAANFHGILGGPFKVVPSHPDLFFFCPPGLDIGSLESGGRRRNETRSSEGASSKHLLSGSSARLKAGPEDEEDRTIEFRSELDDYSIKLVKQESRSEGTDVETAMRDCGGHSNMSVLSQLETESEVGDDEEEREIEAEYSPPLFIQFVLSISQENEDIVCSPVKALPTCLADLFQDSSVPDPEQELNMTSLGLRLDLVCMTLPKQLDSLTTNLASLRSTSLCSSTSYRDSTSLPDDDLGGALDEEVNSGSDVLAHLPEYQHRAVTSVLEEMRWMLRDEVAFAKTKSMPLSEQTLEFVRNHVQSSVDKSGSFVDSFDLNFVFGNKESLPKFKESFQQLELNGFVLREEGNFYHLDMKGKIDESVEEELRASRRKSGRLSRHLQLSPVKETAASSPEESREQSCEGASVPEQSSSDSSTDCIAGLSGLEKDLSVMTERSALMANFCCIFQVNKERVDMYIHYREGDPQAKNTWQTLHPDLVSSIKALCLQVNQSLLLNDLFDTKTCNRLLEPESTRDIFSDRGRLPSHEDDGDDLGLNYLEANLNMKFAPGKFRCPEVWETIFYLHPRLKQGQGHSSQSRGLQALKNVLLPYQVTNRTNMYVYKDDNKNVFYMKLSENLASGFSILSRQNSEAEPPSRTSSIGSSKQLGKEEGVAASRSYSLGESDKKQEDLVTMKVFGIQQAGKNIREDLISVLQKKLDDKVVEVISMMLQRNARCKLSTEDVRFLQRPDAAPDRTLQFTIHPATTQYMQAVAFYLRQNMVTIPLIMPNYTTASTARFKDQCGEGDDFSSGSQFENDVFLYNDANPRGGHKGIACISVALVEGREGGRLVRHSTYPKPAVVEGEGYGLSELEEMTQAELHNVEGDVPAALVQFRIWEQGRVDHEKLTGLLQRSIQHALWDAILEYRMLPAPLAEKHEEEKVEDEKGRMEAESLAKVDANCPQGTSTPNPGLASAASKPHLPDLVIGQTDAVEPGPSTQTDPWEDGSKGRLHNMFSHAVFRWLQTGVDREVPSVCCHTVSLVAKHSLPLVLKEIEAQIATILPDLTTRVFVQRSEEFVPYPKESTKSGEQFILMARNLEHWAVGTRSGSVQPQMMESQAVKATQRFPPLLLPSRSSDQVPPPSPSIIHAPQAPGSVQIPQLAASNLEPPLPASPLPHCSSGVHGLLQTIHTNNQVFVPRHRLVLARVSKKEITLFFYNLSKDCLDRLTRASSHLGRWFTARSSLMSSIVAQKLGLFHNQHFFRSESKAASNPYLGSLSAVEALVKHHSPPSSLASSKGRPLPMLGVRSVYRNKQPSKPLHKMDYGQERDALGRHGRQMLAVWSSEPRDIQQRLFQLWQSRGENCTDVYSPELVAYFKRKARLLHYVFTPMLFLPQWRWQANATRDQSARDQDVFDTFFENKVHLKFQVNGKRTVGGAAGLIEEYKMRHGSGGSRGRQGSGQVNQNEAFHSELLGHYFQEYVQYLQTLGFMTIDSKSATKKSSMRGERVDEAVVRRRTNTNNSDNARGKQEVKTVYLQKSLLGGILIFEISVTEPFLSTKLHAMEASRIQLKSSQTLPGKNFTTTFLDECDRIKVWIHLHSFTYDYHLRTIHNHIAQKPSNLRKGFHIISFLDDFIKYYSKGPNFARNFVHSGLLQIPCTVVTPEHLYNYLLDHEKTYGMDVIRMEPVIIDHNMEFDNEYALVQLSHKKVTYTDNQDVKRSDDFDVSLILSYSGNSDNLLTLKYFLTMTSKRQLYPLFGVEKKLGKFMTVSTSRSLRMIKSMLQNNHALPPSTAESRDTSPEQDTETVVSITSPLLGRLSGIRSETVNYIGYYSAHEETMKAEIVKQATIGEERVAAVVRGATVDCRRDQLWQKLQQDVAASLTHLEFLELISLVHHHTLDKLDKRLLPLMQKGVTWYTGLARVLRAKYGQLCRQFSSEDGKVQHTVVLNDQDFSVFGLVSVDLREGSLAIVHKDEQMPRRSLSSSTMAAYKIVMIRHGESEWNKENKFCGWFDADLSSKGKEEAKAGGVALKEAGYAFDVAHTSLLTRAQVTLGAVLAELGSPDLPVEKTWRLNERHYGGLTGLNKAETAAKHGEEQVKIWRRSFDTPPPPMEPDHPYYETIRKDPRYAGGPTDEEFPTCESLKLTIARTLPYWDEVIVPQLKAGKKILIAAHGNSLRGIVKHLDNMSDADIMGLNLPTGIPFVYELDADMKPVVSMKFLGDEETVRKAMESVAAQGKAK